MNANIPWRSFDRTSPGFGVWKWKYGRALGSYFFDHGVHRCCLLSYFRVAGHSLRCWNRSAESPRSCVSRLIAAQTTQLSLFGHQLPKVVLEQLSRSLLMVLKAVLISVPRPFIAATARKAMIATTRAYSTRFLPVFEQEGSATRARAAFLPADESFAKSAIVLPLLEVKGESP